MLYNFYKDDPNDLIWSVWSVESMYEFGPYLFSFDKKTIYNFWTDYPEKLSDKEIEIFKKELPEMAKLKER